MSTVAGIMFSRLSLWSESTEHNPLNFCTLLRVLVCRLHSPQRNSPCKLQTNTFLGFPPEAVSLYLEVTGYAPHVLSHVQLEALHSEVVASPSGTCYYWKQRMKFRSLNFKILYSCQLRPNALLHSIPQHQSVSGSGYIRLSIRLFVLTLLIWNPER